MSQTVSFFFFFFSPPAGFHQLVFDSCHPRAPPLLAVSYFPLSSLFPKQWQIYNYKTPTSDDNMSAGGWGGGKWKISNNHRDGDGDAETFAKAPIFQLL